MQPVGESGPLALTYVYVCSHTYIGRLIALILYIGGLLALTYHIDRLSSYVPK